MSQLSVKAGVDQSQQRRHGEMGVAWVCEMGLAWWRQSLSQSLCLAGSLGLHFWTYPFSFVFSFFFFYMWAGQLIFICGLVGWVLQIWREPKLKVNGPKSFFFFFFLKINLLKKKFGPEGPKPPPVSVPALSFDWVREEGCI